MHRPNALPTGHWANLPSTKTASSPQDGATTFLKSPFPETVLRPGAGMSSNSATKPASAPALGGRRTPVEACRDENDRC
jgi:hypothetical protein